MMNKYILFPAILCGAGLLAFASLAEAAPGRGGGGGAPGRGAGGGAYRGGYGYGRGYGYGFGGIGIGLYAPFYGYGYAYDPFFYGPRVPSYYPAGVVVGGPASIAGAETAPATPPPEGAPKNAQIKVLLPDANARVWFDGSPTTSTGTERVYHTPDLSPGATPTYRIRAAWVVNGKEVVQEQVIPVAQGRGSLADFTRPFSEPLPLPPPGK